MPRTLRALVLGGLAATLLALPAAAPARTVAPLPAQWQKALNVTAFWWSDLSGKHFRKWLDEAKNGAHADTVVFVVTWYQRFSARSGRVDHLNSTTIAPSYGSKKRCARIGSSWRACKTPSMAALRAAVRAAKARGLKVGIRPQVDVGAAQGSSAPRALIDLRGANRDRWFRSYRRMIAQYGRLARDERADALVVGSGLTGMTNDAQDAVDWRALIDDTRSGALLGGAGFTQEMTYAMTWQEAEAEARSATVHRFPWDDLNAIGIDAYFPLVSVKRPHDDPSVATLAAGWSTGVATATALHEEFGKPVVLTALGYLSRLGTSVAPDNADDVQRANGGRLSQSAQARPVTAAFDVWSALASRVDGSWFSGIWWWEWPAAGRGGPRDGSHSLEGKAAQREVCRRHLGDGSARCALPKRVP
jgi:hypothetical protein